MDITEARKIIKNYENVSMANLKTAFVYLKEGYKTYNAMAEDVGISPGTLSKYDKISQLSKGILWKLKQGDLSAGQAYQISRLENENDQWFLASYIVESDKKQKLTIEECKEVVNNSLEHGQSVKQTLENLYGVKFDKIIPIILPLATTERFALNKVSWTKQKERKDFCYDTIKRRLREKDFFSKTSEIADRLRDLADSLERLS